ncbi:MAG: phosphoglycerate dehydrogenase [Candidatus Aquicultorales bacterium]
MAQKSRVLVSCIHLQKNLERYEQTFRDHDIEVVAPPVAQQLSESDLLDIIDGFDGVIAGDDEFSRSVLRQAKNLKVLIKWGIGVDAIDVEAAKTYGIAFRNTPGVFNDEVADVTIGYVIMLARHLLRLDSGVRKGEWPKIPGRTLRNKVLGVIGVGNIGRAVCQRGLALGMIPVGFDPIPFEETPYVRPVGWEELLAISDFVVVCCALTPANKYMLGDREFDLMKQGAYVVNTSRGPLVREESLIKALASGKIAGAALDVFETEPLPLDNKLRDFDNVVFGTHNASNTIEAVARVNDLSVNLLIEGLEGRLS